MIRITKTYKYWFAFSAILVAGSLALLFAWGLSPGIDFRGGSLMELEFENSVPVPEVREALGREGYENVVVQHIEGNTVFIKTGTLSGENLEQFQSALAENFGEFTEKRFESIGPSIGRELTNKAYWQIVLVSLGIILYLSYAFRRKGEKKSAENTISSWRFGAVAIATLLHDLIITVGVFVILGRLRGVEIDTLFVTALLTILGFSVHDTIVVFDRIRENLERYKYKSFGEIIDYSVNSTLARSINTTSTLLFIMIAMLFFGGSTIFYFVLALLVGVTAGTYSSIFVASPLLYLWQKRSIKAG